MPIIANVTSTNWGNSIIVTYASDEPDDTTVAYTITGVTSAEIDNAALSGNFTVSSGSATLTIQTTVQNSLKNSTLVVSTATSNVSVSVSNFVSITSSANGTYWGGNIRFTVATVNFPHQGNVPYTITGVTSQQINNSSLTGNIVINNTSGNNIGSGSGNVTITTSSSQPVLTQANLNFDVSVANKTVIIRNGTTSEFGKSNITIATSTYIGTEITDVHKQSLESINAAIPNIKAGLQVYAIDPTIPAFEYIDTELSDVHKQNLEAITSTVANTNSTPLPGQPATGILSITPTATYGYSSGTDVKITPPDAGNQAATASTTQIWHMT